jgi:uncharacterized protein
MQITEIRHGMPCWFELTSPDPDKSSAFYQGLFGWRRYELELGPDGTCSFFSNEIGCIGAMSSLASQQQSPGSASTWGVYFAVDDCDDSTAKAVELGAKIVVPPTNVNEHCRMSVVADPFGAVCSLWQSEGGGGPYVMFEENAINWVELATPCSAQAREFYAALLGWDYFQTSAEIPGGGPYHELAVGETRCGGIMPMNADWLAPLPPHWWIFIRVSNLEACVAKAQELGGTNPVLAYEVPNVGRMAMIADPTGAKFYVVQLDSSLLQEPRFTAM